MRVEIGNVRDARASADLGAHAAAVLALRPRGHDFTRDDMRRWVAEQLAITAAAWAAHAAGAAGFEVA